MKTNRNFTIDTSIFGSYTEKGPLLEDHVLLNIQDDEHNTGYGVLLTPMESVQLAAMLLETALTQKRDCIERLRLLRK